MKTTLLLILSFWMTASLIAQRSSFLFSGDRTDELSANTLSTNGYANFTTDRSGNQDMALHVNGDKLEENMPSSNRYEPDYSTSFWIKTATSDANERAIIQHYGGSTGGKGPYGYRIYLKDGNLRAEGRFVFYRWNGIQNKNEYYLTPLVVIEHTGIADGNWHHVVLAIDGKNNISSEAEYKLYVDDAVSGSATSSVAAGLSQSRWFVVPDNIPLTIGADGLSVRSPYPDDIDDVKLYRKTLSAAEVTEVYNQRNPKIIYVDVDASGSRDGSSWANTYKLLTAAVTNATVPGDEIWMADGFYKPGFSQRTDVIDIATPNISIYGGFVGNETQRNQRDWQANETILSGDLLVMIS